MKFTTAFVATSLLALASSTAYATPVVKDIFVGRELLARSADTDNVTYVSPVNDSLPTIALFATGGTIAGSSSSNTDSTGYKAGVVGVQALLDNVPNLKEIANFRAYQVSNIGSESMLANITLKMSKMANELLCSEGSNITALVITHGTDTLEETAFFMDSTVNCGKPVVIVGAMRPSTALSADGPTNIIDAVSVAVSPEAKDRGALIVLNDRIGQAWYTEKTQANYVDAFSAPEPGYIGAFLSTRPFFYYGASKPMYKKTFDISSVDVMPRVDILYGHQDIDVALFDEAIQNGAKGIVYAGAGAGSVPTYAIDAIKAVMDKGIPVVRSTKVNVGAVVADESQGGIAAGLLNPVKARIQLQLALSQGYDVQKVKSVFEDPFETDIAA